MLLLEIRHEFPDRFDFQALRLAAHDLVLRDRRDRIVDDPAPRLGRAPGENVNRSLR